MLHAAEQVVFDEWFRDATLRVDYILSGGIDQKEISVDQLYRSPRWYGKRQHLAELPVEGNAQITMRDHESQRVIFRNSFSTLYQEWFSYPESKSTRRSFENPMILPMPKRPVDITLDMRDNRREVMVTITHQVDPDDILIRHIGEKDKTPFVQMLQPDDTARCIRIAYVAEGYRKDEMGTFLEDVKFAMTALFDHEPFKTLKGRFSIVAVLSPSEDSGVSEPSKGIWKNTVLRSHFDSFYTDRYLTTQEMKKLHDLLAGIPYEHIMILVNSERYGGGGIYNSFNISTTHNDRSRPVIVHEFGHGFCGLGDEYAYDNDELPMYPHDVEPWEPNLTTLVDFHGKWEDLISKKTPIPTPAGGDEKRIGVYEGAGYSSKGVYRAVQDCRMRTNENPEFCVVCRRAIENYINFYTR